MRTKCDLVGHGPRWEKDRRIFASELGDMVLKSIGTRLMIDIVAKRSR